MEKIPSANCWLLMGLAFSLFKRVYYYMVINATFPGGHFSRHAFSHHTRPKASRPRRRRHRPQGISVPFRS